MKNDHSIALVAFYEASSGGHGAAEVTLSLYDSINCKKKKFEIKKYSIFKFFEKINLNIFENIFKLIYLVVLSYKIVKYLNQYKKNIVIIEGASWIGYSYFTIKIIKFFKPKTKFIYHAHNIEYYLRRRKNNIFISFLTKVLEKKLYKIVDIGTVVSKLDQIEIKKLYKIKTLILSNGINKKRLKIKKINKHVPKNFIIFSGSYSFFPNKESINLIIHKIFPKILKKYPDMKLVITGKDFPIDKFNNYNFIYYYKDIPKHYLNYLFLKSKFLLAPMFNATGTKLKIIEALMLGSIIISSKEGMNGIFLPKKINPPFIFNSKSEMYKMVDIAIKNNRILKKNAKFKSYFFRKNYSMENITKGFFADVKLIINK